MTDPSPFYRQLQFEYTGPPQPEPDPKFSRMDQADDLRLAMMLLRDVLDDDAHEQGRLRATASQGMDSVRLALELIEKHV